MQINIHTTHHKPDTEINQYLEYRIGFAFSRTRQFIRAIDITLSDINGPKGGVDQQCKVLIKPYSSKTIVICERQSELKHAIDRCITRASRNFIQRMKRKNILAKKRVSHQSLELAVE